MTDTAQVIRPKFENRKARAVRKEVRTRRKLRRQAFAGVGVLAVALALVALSLTHLAHGIGIVTNAPDWQTWALAIGVDLGFVALEFAGLTAATEKARRAVAKWVKHGVVGLLILSAVLNAFAFAWTATGILVYPAAALGLAVPVLIYVLTQVGSKLWTIRD